METPNRPQSATHKQDKQDLVLIAEVLEHCMREPLAALRATLDTFARRQVGRNETSIAHAALEQVVGLGRIVHDLCDFAAPPALRPSRCTVEEIVRGALDELAPEQRPRVLLALEDGRARLFTDGPLLSRCLAHLIAGGMHAEAECMLHSRRSGGRSQFMILHTPPIESTVAHGSLGHVIAQRDIRRMGGVVSFHSSAGTSTCVIDGIADAKPREAAA